MARAISNHEVNVSEVVERYFLTELFAVKKLHLRITPPMNFVRENYVWLFASAYKCKMLIESLSVFLQINWYCIFNLNREVRACEKI